MMKTSDVIQQFPELAEILQSESAGSSLKIQFVPVTIPKGTTLFRPGESCRQYLLVQDGSIKVQQQSPDGREIVLYRVQCGESCVLTTTSLLAATPYTATGIAETDVNAISLPAQAFHELLNQSPRLRKLVFDNYSQRLSELLELVRSLAFAPLESRLAQRLLQLADACNTLEMTHQALATDLGSTREVISRKLKEFERLGWLRLHRGHIEILDRPAIAALADPDDNP
jgi:CRP/FNR family transcriptional regulator